MFQVINESSNITCGMKSFVVDKDFRQSAEMQGWHTQSNN